MTTKLFTRKEAAERLGVSLMTLRRRIDAGEIETVNIAATTSKQRSIRIADSALEDYIKERTNVA
jgi:excisionase family DNA binding protein